MNVPLIASDLLSKGMLTDKHFLLPQLIEVDLKSRKVYVFLNSNDPLVKLGDNIEGDLPTIKEVVAKKSKTSDGAYHNMLISGGAVVALGKNWDEAQVIFLKKDAGAPTDPGYVTMPAGRMDQRMAAHCFQEIEEISLFGKMGDDDVIFVPMMGNVASGSAAFSFKKAAVRAKVPNAEERKVHFVKSIDLPVPNSWTIELYLDKKKIEVLSNVMVAVDEVNHTLEYRQMILLDISLGQKQFYLGDDPAAPLGILEGIGDGDGFGRDSMLVSVANLKKYLAMVDSADENILRAMLLNSQTPGLDVTVTTVPGGGKFHRFFWNAKGVKLPFTTTVTEFVRVFLNQS